MITVYHLENSRSERTIWLLEELGLPYDLQRFPREPSMMAGAAYRALHPMGKSPIIRDGDQVLIESGAIVQYIVDRYGSGRLSVPTDSTEYARYLQWLHFAEGSAMTQLIVDHFVRRFVPGTDQSLPLIEGMKGRTAHLLKFIEGELADRPYFAGAHFTAADIMMAYCFGLPRGPLRVDMAQYPNIMSYLGRIEQRPAYQKAMAIANPSPGTTT